MYALTAAFSLAFSIASARLLDADLHYALFTPAKTHQNPMCNVNVRLSNSPYSTYLDGPLSSKGMSFGCTSDGGTPLCKGKPSSGSGILPLPVAQALTTDQVRFGDFTCRSYGSVPLSAFPVATPGPDGATMAETTPEPVSGSPSRIKVTATVLAPQADGLNLQGVTMSSQLNYLVLSVGSEDCVFTGNRARRFDVSGTYTLLKSDVDLLAPASFCKDSLELRPDQGFLNASGIPIVLVIAAITADVGFHHAIPNFGCSISLWMTTS